MGNYTSCTLPIGKQSKPARVIFPSGEIKTFRQPTKAAELMLEIPNYFLANSRSLHIGRRFSALGADEDLENANVYVMFPMRKIKAVVVAADMASVFLAVNRRGPGKVRVVPAITGETESATCEVEGSRELVSPEFQYRRSCCRSKKPELETIVEEPAVFIR